MNTNASGRNEEFWTELGKLFAISDSTLTFSVDGCPKIQITYTEEDYTLKIMNAMKWYIKAGGVARWEFLVFKHNQHQIEQARQLANELGSGTFMQKKEPLGL